MQQGGVRHEIEQIFRSESSAVLATLIRLVGDFDLAEDSMQAAFVVALERWHVEGIPANPRSWLISTGRFKAIDALRRRARFTAALQGYVQRHGSDVETVPPFDESTVHDDQLRLIFICCHPALSREAQAALTLREVCGLTTEEIASAYLTSPPTIGQRIVRAKAKIREERIPFELPDASELPSRMASVLTVAYLLFSEGYYASAGDALTRQVLSHEAIRLARLLVELAPEPEVFGLLALMLLQESRSAARTTQAGDLILFDDQDASLWDRELYTEGMAMSARVMEAPDPAEYALQAAIARVHMEGALAGTKDWRRIVALYDQLLYQKPSVIVELNRAVAVAMAEGPSQGLAIVDRLLAEGGLEDYALAHSTRADFCRRLCRLEESLASYTHALTLTNQAAQRRFLQQRVKEVSADLQKL